MAEHADPELLKEIRGLVEAQGMTIAEACRRSGLSRNSVTSILSPKAKGSSVTVKTAQRLKNALGGVGDASSEASSPVEPRRYSSAKAVERMRGSIVDIEHRFDAALKPSDELRKMLMEINESMNGRRLLEDSEELQALLRMLTRVEVEHKLFRDQTQKLLKG